MKNRLVFLFLLCIMGSHIRSSAADVITHLVDSEYLQEKREIHVILPNDYDPGSDKNYEVIYITDGEWILDTFSFIYHFSEYEKFVPSAILVGIPNIYVNGLNQRDRDFLPVHDPEFPRSGGADKFLLFVKNELIPFIDEHYATSRERSIYGHSFGGLFSFYCLLKEPQLFQTFYATDSPFRWNDEYLIKLASKQLNGFGSEKKWWFAGRESARKYMGADRLASLLKAKSPENLVWGSAVYPNENHNSVKLKAIYDGIKFANSN